MRPDSKPSRQNIIFFTVMFAACIIGSVAIFLFAVGIEVGDPIIRTVMEVLVKNFALVLVAFGAFNAAVFGAYWLRQKNVKGEKVL